MVVMLLVLLVVLEVDQELLQVVLELLDKVMLVVKVMRLGVLEVEVVKALLDQTLHQSIQILVLVALALMQMLYGQLRHLLVLVGTTLVVVVEVLITQEEVLEVLEEEVLAQVEQ
jgi:hypothetical protein